MRLEWMNEEQTILFVETGEVDLVLEPGHPDWPEYSLREDIAPYTPPWQPSPLSIWRSSASLSRAEFCIALKRVGILPANEAKQAAKGDWPATFAGALADFPDADEAEITWAAITTVDRMHPMLLSLQSFTGIPDADLDAMFGWAAV